MKDLSKILNNEKKIPKEKKMSKLDGMVAVQVFDIYERER